LHNSCSNKMCQVILTKPLRIFGTFAASFARPL
jgi:hypothetical protein